MQVIDVYLIRRDLLKQAYQSYRDADTISFGTNNVSNNGPNANESPSNYLARLVLGHRLGRDPNDIETIRGATGRPRAYVHDALDYNLSDSGDVIGIGVAHGMLVGLDLEVLGRERTPIRVAWRFFSDAENQDLKTKPFSEKGSYFLLLWTLKESYIKANGWRLADVSLSDFGFRIVSGTIHFWSQLAAQPLGKFTYFATGVYEGVRVSVCATGDIPSAINLRIHEISEIRGSQFEASDASLIDVLSS